MQPSLRAMRAKTLSWQKPLADIDRTIDGGRLAITDDLAKLAAAGRIDVVIDATGNPNIGHQPSHSMPSATASMWSC